MLKTKFVGMANNKEKEFMVSEVDNGTQGANAVVDKKKRDRSRPLRDDGAPVETTQVEATQVMDLALRFEVVERDVLTLQEHVFEELEEIKKAEDVRQSAKLEWKGLFEKIFKMMEKMQATIDLMQSDVAKCKKAMANGGASMSHHALRVEQLKPKVFDGKRDAQEVDTFLWHLERYFEGLNIDDETTKVRTASLYLSGLAALWWRRRHADMEKGLCLIDTLEEFKMKLKRYFYSKNVVNESQKKMKELKHTMTISEYMKEFTTLMVQIPDMTEDQLVFNFVDGLQEWAQKEVKMHDFSTVDEAIAITESLTEYQKSSQVSKGKDHKGGSSKGGGEKK